MLTAKLDNFLFFAKLVTTYYTRVIKSDVRIFRFCLLNCYLFCIIGQSPLLFLLSRNGNRCETSKLSNQISFKSYRLLRFSHSDKLTKRSIRHVHVDFWVAAPISAIDLSFEISLAEKACNCHEVTKKSNEKCKQDRKRYFYIVTLSPAKVKAILKSCYYEKLEKAE